MHALELSILRFQLLGALLLRGAHPSVLGLPVVVGRVRDPLFAAQIFYLTPASASFKIPTIWVSVNRDFFL